MPTRTVPIVLLAALSGACSSLPAASDRAADSPAAIAPGTTAVVGDGDSVWGYLADKYDGDADGTVTAVEYTRDDESFERLDKDDDGVLTSADFASESGDSPMRNPAMMATMIMMQTFQADDEESLSRGEVEQSFARLDTDGDGQLTRDEVEAEPARGMMARMDRFGSLTAAADSDEDEQLSADELLTLFDENDSDGDGTWTMGGRRGAGRRGARGEDDPSEPPLAAQGNVAPDFTLETLHDGRPVSLSSFKGDRPVALIFGSYT